MLLGSRMMKNILVIGGNSKLAKIFIKYYKYNTNLFITYRGKDDATIVEEDGLKAYELNLGDISSVLNFVKKVSEINFDAVLFFASTYLEDSRETNEYYRQILNDLKVNALSPYIVSRELKVNHNCKFIFFGDSVVNQPRKNKHSYSLSKHSLEYVVQMLAIERRNEVATICFRLGPTCPPESVKDKDKYYYSNSAINVPNIAEGLIETIDFIINKDNLNMTGAFIDYDAGFYLRNTPVNNLD